MPSFFENRMVGSTATIDIDVFMDYFIRPIEEVPEGERPGLTIGVIRDKISMMYEKTNLNPTCFYRRSSGGHIHIRLIFDMNLSVLDAFMIRAFLYDDKDRLTLDMSRYLITGSLHEMNRTFDEKATIHGGIARSGPWIPLSCDRKDITGEALEDFKSFDFAEAHRKSLKAQGIVTKEEKIKSNQRELGFL